MKNIQLWTDNEKKILKTNWENGGIRICQKLLPNRSKTAIQRQAVMMNLKLKNRNPYTKVNWTEFLDRQIIEAYANPKANIKSIAMRLGIKPGAFRYRATILGCQKRYEHKLWTKTEDQIIMDNPTKGLRTLWNLFKQNGFTRSMSAILARRYYLGEGNQIDVDNFTANQLAKLCGCSDRTVDKWINKGYLKATRQGGKFTIKNPSNIYWKIKLKDFKDFIRNYPNAIDLRKVDSIWFIEICLGLPKAHVREVSSSSDEQ